MDHFDLDRFVHAQAQSYGAVIKELQSGRKQSHWMWYIFPQLAGLGSSPTAQKYAIKSLNEARAYTRHELLGPRLVECTNLVMCIEATPIEQIFGYPDYLKFRSCMTLFHETGFESELFMAALAKYFSGLADQRTLELLRESQ